MTAQTIDAQQRRSGVALWRQIADQLQLDIASGLFPLGEKLPAETALGERFGVNRHTIRSALAALATEGVVRTEQGRGTFVEAARRLSYTISKHTRFSAGLAGQARSARSELLTAGLEPANAHLAVALKLSRGTALLRLETISNADGRPLSRATHWLEAERFEGIDLAFAKSGSITRALARFGVPDYVRAKTRISARFADNDEIARLKLTPAAIVLVSEGLDIVPDGPPVQLVLSRFAAGKMDLVVE